MPWPTVEWGLDLWSILMLRVKGVIDCRVATSRVFAYGCQYLVGSLNVFQLLSGTFPGLVSDNVSLLAPGNECEARRQYQHQHLPIVFIVVPFVGLPSRSLTIQLVFPNKLQWRL